MDTFDWSDFLDKTNTCQVPEEIFSHVTASYSNGIEKGMLLEICHKTNPDVYWIGEITMVCGAALRIQYIGAKTDFWCDLTSRKVHPLGWCGKYDEQIEPPDEINEMHGDRIIDIMKKALLDGISVSREILNHKGMLPLDRIKTGMKIEVQNVLDPYRYWIATIRENVGGRLQLSYDGSDGEDVPTSWLFFTNPRLSSFGYVTNKGSPWYLKYPGKQNKFSDKNRLSAQLRLCAEESIKDPTPADLFQPNQSNLEVHNFVIGMKVEALDPHDMKSFRPATVTKVFNNYHFLVVLDDHIEDYEDTKMAWLCDSKHPYIYPIGWAQKQDLNFTAPKIWKDETFDWDDYLSETSSVPAPEYCFAKQEYSTDKIKLNMKLEAVNPLHHEEIHVASVVDIAEHMLLIHLIPIGEKVWYSQTSDLLFPVGWCDSHQYELHIPNPNAVEEIPLEPMIEVKKPEEVKVQEEWCETIFFNGKCYAGPSISRNKLAQLPKRVGPGPLSLVLKEVLNKLIGASYKPAKLLRDWEAEEAGEGMRLELLKAKLKTSSYHAYVPVVTSVGQVSQFCRDICAKLQSCPYLLSTVECAPPCPETCQQVDKSRFRESFTKDSAGIERRGRPKGSLKSKKKKGSTEKSKDQPTQENGSNKDGTESAPESEPSTPPSEPNTRPNSPEPEKRKRKHKNNYPKLEMKTRGAKLPNFAIQMKEAHWDKKDMNTIYSSSTTKKQSHDTDSTSSGSVSRKNGSDVSDEEPPLKKPKQSDEDKKSQLSEMALWLQLKLSNNPVKWNVNDVHKYLSNTEDCKLIADRMKQEEIDGFAFISLDLPLVRDLMHMKSEYAWPLCKHVAKLRWHYIENFHCA